MFPRESFDSIGNNFLGLSLDLIAILEFNDKLLGVDEVFFGICRKLNFLSSKLVWEGRHIMESLPGPVSPWFLSRISVFGELSSSNPKLLDEAFWFELRPKFGCGNPFFLVIYPVSVS